MATKNPNQNKALPFLLGTLVLLGGLAFFVQKNFLQGGEYRQHLSAGSAFFESKQTSKAMSEWQAAIKADPTQPQPYQLLSDTYIQTGRPAEAIPLLKQLITIAPQTKGVYSQLAEVIALTGKGNIADAAKEAVAREPDSAKAHAILGISYGNQQNHAMAVSELRKATLLAPTDNTIIVSLAQAQLNAADLEGAEKTARTVIAQSPNYATAWYVLGWSFSRRTPTPNNIKEALNAFEKSIIIDPTNVEVMTELGRLYLSEGRLPQAQTMLEKAWRGGTHTDQLAFQLAQLYRRQNNTAKATEMQTTFEKLHKAVTEREALTKRLSTNPNDADTALALAELEFEAENTEEALSLLQGVLQVRPSDPHALRDAIRFFEKVGDSARVKEFKERLAKIESTKPK
jgi:Flp pilus assembly protein TadD